jgi:hypothetical protein
MKRTRKPRLDLATASPDAMVPGPRREAAIAYQRLSEEVPTGLHQALRDLLHSFVAIAERRPATLFSDLISEVTPTRVLVSTASDDPVVYGIQRQFTMRAMHSCHRCGRKGHARKALGGRVRCASCAAPELMLQEIGRILDRAKRSGPRGRSENAMELPPVLLPVFRAFTLNWANASHARTGNEGGDIESAWHRSLRELAHDLRHGRASSSTPCHGQ